MPGGLCSAGWGVCQALVVRRLGTLSLRLRPEWVDLKPMTGTGAPLEKFTLDNLTVRSEVHTRDRVPYTRTGKHHILE